MKTLGLLGGMSWESTSLYYQALNRLARERLGGQHSAKLLIWSSDFAPIAALQAAGAWDEASALLVQAAKALEAAGADAIMICANTMHLVAPQVAAAVGIPVLHIGEATAGAIKAADVKRPLLLATRFTMEQSFYRDYLSAAGVDAVIPQPDERQQLHAIIFEELVQGRFEPASRERVKAICRRAIAADGADGVIFGCTEFGLLLRPGDIAAPVFDTALLHAEAGINFALG